MLQLLGISHAHFEGALYIKTSVVRAFPVCSASCFTLRLSSPMHYLIIVTDGCVKGQFTSTAMRSVSSWYSYSFGGLYTMQLFDTVGHGHPVLQLALHSADVRLCHEEVFWRKERCSTPRTSQLRTRWFGQFSLRRPLHIPQSDGNDGKCKRMYPASLLPHYGQQPVDIPRRSDPVYALHRPYQ